MNEQDTTELGRSAPGADPAQATGEMGDSSELDAQSGLERVVSPLSTIADAVTDLRDYMGRIAGDDPAGNTWSDLNGMLVAADADEMLIPAEPVGQTKHGMPMLPTEDHPAMIRPNTSYVGHEYRNTGKMTQEIVGADLAKQRPALLEGVPGVGKNTLLRSLGYPAGLPIYRENFGSNTSIYQLVANSEVRAGNSVSVLGPLALAAIFGGIFVADEVNMATGDVTSQLHNAFEDLGERSVKINTTGRILRDLPEDVDWDPDNHLGQYLHPQFYTAATMNPLGFTGTNPMNAAFRDRMKVRQVGYIDKEIEARTLAEKTSADAQAARELVQVAAGNLDSDSVGGLRGLYAADKIDTPVTFRRLRSVLEFMQEHDVTLKEAGYADLPPVAQMQEDRHAIEDAVKGLPDKKY